MKQSFLHGSADAAFKHRFDFMLDDFTLQVNTQEFNRLQMQSAKRHDCKKRKTFQLLPGDFSSAIGKVEQAMQVGVQQKC